MRLQITAALTAVHLGLLPGALSVAAEQGTPAGGRRDDPLDG